MHVAGKLDGVGADAVVAEYDAVRRVAVAHEQAVGPDYGLLPVGRSEVNGRELADHRAVADLDVGDGTVLVLEVLGLHAYAGIGKYLAHRADRRVAVDYRALPDDRAVTQLDIFANMGVRADLHVGAERRAVFDYRCWMDFHGFVTFQPLGI